MSLEASIDIEDAGLGEAFAAALEGKGVYSEEPAPVVEPVAEAAPVEQPIETPTEPKEYTKVLEELSGGIVKGDDDFKTVLQKAKERDELETRLKETEGKVIN